jgi:hypothetical protein
MDMSKIPRSAKIFHGMCTPAQRLRVWADLADQ